MHGPTNMDYSKLLGFDMVIDELGKGVDFNNPTLGAKLGAKVGGLPSVPTKTFSPRVSLPVEIAAPGAPVMSGLGGRKVPAPEESKAIQSGVTQSSACDPAPILTPPS